MARPFCSGVSMSSQVSDMMRLIEYYLPDYKQFSFLDLGAGKGMYGYILRCIFGFGDKVQLHAVDLKYERKFYGYVTGIYNVVRQCNLINEYDKLGFENYDIILAQQVMEHLPEYDALKCLERMKLAKCSIVGFPAPKDHYKQKEDPAAHLWGCSDEKLFNIGYNRVDAIENNHVYIWMNTWRGEKHWKLRGE